MRQLPDGVRTRRPAAATLVLALVVCLLAAACSDSGTGAPASPSPAASLDTSGAEQAVRDFVAANLPDDPRGLADSYELVRILPAEEAAPPWEISYRVGFTVHPGTASSSSLDGTMFARFILARDTTTGAWRVWPKSLWVRQYIRDYASQ